MSKQTQIYRIVQEDANISKLGPLTESKHTKQRKQQRAINDDMIKIALTYGRKEYSEGALRYTLTDRSLNHTPLYLKRSGRSSNPLVNKDRSVA